MINWLKKWYVLLIYSVIIGLLVFFTPQYFFTTNEELNFNNISLLVGFMALWGVIYTSIVNKDSVLLQIKNSNNQLRLKFNSENRLKALISVKRVLNNVLITKQPGLTVPTTSTTREDTLWFEKERPFYLHYLPTEIRDEIKRINKKRKTNYWFSEEYYEDIKSLCVSVNNKIEDMADLKILDELYK